MGNLLSAGHAGGDHDGVGGGRFDGWEEAIIAYCH
jgi:hypothetical protein